jgi:DNA (cytosine-5)-methyltransferase 1
MAGNRGDDWGKEKKFREGQAEQVLDTLFFDFIDLAKELQPKVVVAENVKGLLLGEARNYVRRILKQFDAAGYYVVYNLLDASTMGVPQKRERVFFTAIRKDLAKNVLRQVDMFTSEPYLKLDFNEKPVYFKDFYNQNGENDRPITAPEALRLWNLRQSGDLSLSYSAEREGNVKFWNSKYLLLDKIPLTFTTNDGGSYLFDEPRSPNKYEVSCMGSFPQDYDYNGNKYAYLIGMSVPPLMTARLANEIYGQWLSKI